jgi:hypothetical protein
MFSEQEHIFLLTRLPTWKAYSYGTPCPRTPIFFAGGGGGGGSAAYDRLVHQICPPLISFFCFADAVEDPRLERRYCHTESVFDEMPPTSGGF